MDSMLSVSASNATKYEECFSAIQKGALRSAAQMVPYEVSIGLILIVRLVSAFGSAKAIARMFP
nr:NADH dehydrogenase subunit I [Ipomoea batatas]GME14985.1 NADH dehydrogenase subunit I [Ipomoea batatas]